MKRTSAVIPMSDSSKAISREDVSPTVLPDAFLGSDIARSAGAFTMPRYAALPAMPLYRDQVITYIEQVFSPLPACTEGPWITGPMINNYVKTGLLPAPVKKQYGREQVARLIIICTFKQFLPIAAIQRLFAIQRVTYPVDIAFDYVAVELEHALRSVFETQAPYRDSAHQVTRESLLVRSAVAAFAAKAYLLSYLDFTGFES